MKSEKYKDKNNYNTNNANEDLALDKKHPVYLEMNRMFIISFCNVFRNAEFKEKFKDTAIDFLRALMWILTSTVPVARRIVHRMSRKARDRKKPVRSSTVQDKDYIRLKKLGTMHVSQPFWAALAIHSFAKKVQCVQQGFKITLVDQKCSNMFLNAVSYGQRISDCTAKVNPLNIELNPIIFKLLVCFYCLNWS